MIKSNGDVNENIVIRPLKREDGEEVLDLIFNWHLWEQIFWEPRVKLLQHRTTWLYFFIVVAVTWTMFNPLIALLFGLGYFILLYTRLWLCSYSEFKKIENYEEFQNFPEFYLNPNDWNHLWVACDGKKIIGSVGLKKDSEEEIMLVRLGVKPQYRQRGLGTKLSQIAIDFAKTLKGVKLISLDTKIYNKKSNSVYRTLGFEPTRQDHLFTVIPFGLEIVLQIYTLRVQS